MAIACPTSRRCSLAQAREAELAKAQADLVQSQAREVSADAGSSPRRLAVEKMRRTLFAKAASGCGRLLDQMELELEELEASASEDELAAEMAVTAVRAFTRKAPSRKPFSEHLPRERILVRGPTACACCGSSRLAKLGEDVTETLEVVPRHWRVLQHVRAAAPARRSRRHPPRAVSFPSFSDLLHSVPAPAVMSWSGFYVGAHVGYGRADFDFQDPSITVVGVPGLVLPGGGLTLGLPIERKFDGDGFLGGGQVGVNAQWGGLVVGVEGDLSRTNLDGKVRSSAGPIPIPPLESSGATKALQRTWSGWVPCAVALDGRWTAFLFTAPEASHSDASG